MFCVTIFKELFVGFTCRLHSSIEHCMDVVGLSRSMSDVIFNMSLIPMMSIVKIFTTKYTA